MSSNGKFLKRKYVFADLSVMMRVSDGRYLNLTDLNLSEEREYMELNATSQFLLCFCTFCKQEIYAAPVTYEELVELSRSRKLINIVRESFGDEEDSLQIGAQIAAKKILDIAYGSVRQRIEGDEIWYDFIRQTTPRGEDGKRRKVQTVILSKKLMRVDNGG